MTTTDPTTAALAPRDAAAPLVTPAADAPSLVAAMAAYEATKAALLTAGDYQHAGAKSFIKRAGWRKLAIAFAVDLELVERTITRDDRGRVLDAEFVYRAIAPNGRHVDGWGNCAADERCCYHGCTINRDNHYHCPAADGQPCDTKRHFTKPNHDVPATAETRAKNRACSDLFGLGEVSAEEVDIEAASAASRSAAASTTDIVQGQPAKCPACGSGVYDNREANEAREARGDKRMPAWKCRNKECVGSENRNGEPQPWISWHDDPVKAGVIQVATPAADKMPDGRAGWVLQMIAQHITAGDLDEALRLAGEIAPLTGKEPNAQPTEGEAAMIVATAWFWQTVPERERRDAIRHELGLTGDEDVITAEERSDVERFLEELDGGEPEA